MVPPRVRGEGRRVGGARATGGGGGWMGEWVGVESARRRQTLLRSLRLDFLGLLQLAPGVAPKRGVGAAAGSRAGEGPTVVPRRGEGGQARAAARRVGFAAQRQVSAGPPRARTVVGAPVLMTPLVECHGCGGGDPPPDPLNSLTANSRLPCAWSSCASAIATLMRVVLRRWIAESFLREAVSVEALFLMHLRAAATVMSSIARPASSRLRRCSSSASAPTTAGASPLAAAAATASTFCSSGFIDLTTPVHTLARCAGVVSSCSKVVRASTFCWPVKLKRPWPRAWRWLATNAAAAISHGHRPYTVEAGHTGGGMVRKRACEGPAAVGVRDCGPLTPQRSDGPLSASGAGRSHGWLTRHGGGLGNQLGGASVMGMTQALDSGTTRPGRAHLGDRAGCLNRAESGSWPK